MRDLTAPLVHSCLALKKISEGNFDASFLMFGGQWPSELRNLSTSEFVALHSCSRFGGVCIIFTYVPDHNVLTAVICVVDFIQIMHIYCLC